ncbi:MAG: OmpA family protein [Pseudomonadota bacterium]
MKRTNQGPVFALALIAGLCASSLASADQSPADREFDKRWYVGAGVGATRLEPEPRSTAMTVGDDSSNSAALYFGRDLNKHYSVEGHIATLGEAGIDFLGSRVGDLDYTVAGISAVRYLHNTRDAEGPDEFDDEGLYRREGLSFYARVGLGAMDNSSSLQHETENKVHLLGGLGMEYGWQNGFAVRLETTAYDTDAREVSMRLLKRIGASSPYSAAAAALPTVVALDPVPETTVTPTPVPLPTPAAPPLASFSAVLFGFDQDEITPAYASELQGLARLLNDNPGLRVVIEGHTDYIGTETYNQGLSVRRARSVVEYLFSLGVPVDQLQIEGFGETRPVADNATSAGRALNRRVDVIRQ